MDESLEGLKPIEACTSLQFDEATYGHIVSHKAVVKVSSRGRADPGFPQRLVAETPLADFAVQTASEKNPWVQLDLGQVTSVTAVRVLDRISTGRRLMASYSLPCRQTA